MSFMLCIIYHGKAKARGRMDITTRLSSQGRDVWKLETHCKDKPDHPSIDRLQERREERGGVR